MNSPFKTQMVVLVKLPTNPADLSLIPRSHRIEGKNKPPQAVLQPLYILFDTEVASISIINKCTKIYQSPQFFHHDISNCCLVK